MRSLNGELKSLCRSQGVLDMVIFWKEVAAKVCVSVACAIQSDVFTDVSSLLGSASLSSFLDEILETTQA